VNTLPEIPLIDVCRGGTLAVFEAFPDRVARLVEVARRRYGKTALRVGDRISRRWLHRSNNPYFAELEAIAPRMGTAGLYMLNLSYEWACTTAVCSDPRGSGTRLLRTLDWRLSGLGACTVVSRHEAPAGPWLNVTWPGFVGALTVLAPGRFAAAINQPPMRMSRFGPVPAPFVYDWIAARYGVLRQKALPPAHLLRRAAEEARNYEEARIMLTREPICAPTFYTLAGARPDEGCLIERLHTRAFVHEAPVAAANHWLADSAPAGRPRTATSRERHAMLTAAMAQAVELEWVQAPILNKDTRLAAVANAATGQLVAQGFEDGAPATRQTFFTA